MKRLIRRLLPRALGPKTILAGPLRGSRIVTSWHDYPAAITGRTEAHLLQWLASHVRPGSTWLDVGAHYGYTAVALSRLTGSAGRVFAFEPVAATAGCIAQTRYLNHLRQLAVVPLGLGAPETLDRATMPITRGMADLTTTVGVEDWQETIYVARFDWLWPRINGASSRIDGVKIDVQGMELEVLNGMATSLRAERPLIAIEFHAGVDRPAILRLLNAIGYSSARRNRLRA